MQSVGPFTLEIHSLSGDRQLTGAADTQSEFAIC